MRRRDNPFEDLERMFERMTDQFDEAADLWGEGALPETGSQPAVDVVDRDDEVVVTVDVPGFDSDDVDIRVTDRTLEVEAEHSEETEKQEGEFVRQERRHASMSRSLRLPADVDPDPDAASATLQNGVLTVTLPKAESEESRRIDVE